MTETAAKEPKKYRVEAVGDFLQIPAHRIDQCLREFCAAIKGAHTLNRMYKAVAEGGFNVEAELRGREFVWTDDGEENLRFHISTKGEGE